MYSLLRLKKEFEEKQNRKAHQAEEEKIEDEESDIGSDVWVRTFTFLLRDYCRLMQYKCKFRYSDALTVCSSLAIAPGAAR